MKSWIAAAALGVLCGAAAHAQPQDQRWGGGWSQAPSGSYQQTCRDIRVNGEVLTASCPDDRGRWNYSTLRYRDCRGDIGASNGRLMCGGGWGQLPPGSYQQSCRDARVSGNLLTASCRDDRGRWNYSTLDFRNCRGDIGNANGRLACGWNGGGGPNPPWGGGNQNSTLMLYSAPDFGGQAYQATREITNLPKQFNDKAMSLRIQGRGAWQICSDSDFRGRCQIFDRDVGDLRQYGLGEAVSSMRPVSGRPY